MLTDKKTRLIKRPLKRWEKLIAYSVVIGIILGIITDVVYSQMNKPIIYEAEASELATGTPAIVEVKIEWDRARIEEEIRKVFPEAPEIAVAVAKAESGLRETAYNPEAHKNRRGEVICYGSFGIMQIGCVHNIKDSEGLYDIEYNLQKARAIYDDSLRRRGNGWLPWGAYTDGRYLQYL